jgi:L-fuculose-phosphate aldolase
VTSVTDRRAEVVATAKAMSRAGLAPGTAGNVSVRSPSGLWITPTGLSYQGLIPDDIVELDRSGRVVWGRRAPSSEWRLHVDILAARPDVTAIVHTHSPEATALSCTRRGIPAFHYYVARAGGADIRCATYATYGSAELAENAVTALAGRKACLLANHGVVALGVDLGRALALAEEVELLAGQYARAVALGGPVILDEGEMARVAAKLAGYGQPM